MNDQAAAQPGKYFRFPLVYRIEHWVQFAAFTTLALTGLPQKFGGAGISKWFIGLLGGIETVRTIHHTAAVILMVSVVFHIGAAFYRVYVQGHRMSMLPTVDDIRNAINSFKYNLGLIKNRVQQGRYTFEEKAEYWAFMWGTIVMVVTGFMMWNPIATTRYLPGQFIPASKAAHGAEAVLAVLAIFIWHIYQVHIRNFNKSMFTGYMSEHEMLEEHPLELADIKAGIAPQENTPKTVEQRKRYFYPIYGLVAVVLLFGIYRFVTFEQTAITTLPAAETVAVFLPETPTPLPSLVPTNTAGVAAIQPTAAPGTETAALVSSWNADVGDIFQAKCTMCHNSTAKTAGLDLSSYASAMAGSISGPVITAGDPGASKLVQVQSAGGHPGQLTPDELAVVEAWIQASAPEEAGTAAGAGTTSTQAPAGAGASASGWDAGIGAIFQSKCTTCHNPSTKTAGLDLSSYASAMAGSASGPVILPDDASGSKLVQVQSAGGHPGQLTPEELSQVEEWIQPGAGSAPASTPAPSGSAALTWDGAIGAVFQAKCTMCHNSSAKTAGLDLSSYAGAMAGGSSGPVITAGDPDASKLVQVQSAGGHPGQLSSDELAQVKDWIQGGALEK